MVVAGRRRAGAAVARHTRIGRGPELRAAPRGRWRSALGSVESWGTPRLRPHSLSAVPPLRPSPAPHPHPHAPRHPVFSTACPITGSDSSPLHRPSSTPSLRSKRAGLSLSLSLESRATSGWRSGCQGSSPGSAVRFACRLAYEDSVGRLADRRVDQIRPRGSRFGVGDLAPR